jgi:hypothetical protein
MNERNPNDLLDEIIWNGEIRTSIDRITTSFSCVKPSFRNIGLAFASNMEALHRLSTFLLLQTTLRVHETVLQPRELAALIEANAHHGQVTEDQERLIRCNAREEFLKHDVNRTNLLKVSVAQVCSDVATTPLLGEYVAENNRQLLVLLWSTIEVLLKSFLEAVLNVNHS